SNFISLKLISVLRSLFLFCNYFLKIFSKLSIYKKGLFCLLILFIGTVKIYFLSRFPFHVDEVASYLFFVKKGFFVTISYYPSPNNHILYSVIAYLMQPFISDPYYLMKIPSCIISIITSGILFLFLLKNFNFSTSLLGTLLFSFATNYFVYSISGRGYALMTSFTIISTFMMLEIISSRNEKFLWHSYVFSTVLGFYTLSIFLYPFVTLSLIVLVYSIIEKKYNLLKPFLYYNLLIVCGVLLLYTPVFLISGVSSITSNGWMIKLDWNSYFSLLPKFITGAFEFILGFDNFAMLTGLTIIISAILILIATKRKTWLLLVVAFFVTPVFLLTLQRLQPYNRVWCYLIFPTSLCVLFIFDYLFSLIGKINYARITLTIICVSTIIGYTLVHFYEMTNHGYLMYDNVSRITRYIVMEKDVKVYTNDDSYNLFLRYESSQIGKNVIPEMAAMPTTSEFNYVLLTKDATFPVTINKMDYLLKEKDDFIEVYKHK
ncbi:MAG TPA: hypothetical protein VNW06_10380, partial [Cytophagaceae bacterium]|nr:hypothetical protein [Cytophagaceae bacterium]